MSPCNHGVVRRRLNSTYVLGKHLMGKYKRECHLLKGFGGLGLVLDIVVWNSLHRSCMFLGLYSLKLACTKTNLRVNVLQFYVQFIVFKDILFNVIWICVHYNKLALSLVYALLCFYNDVLYDTYGLYSILCI